MMPGWSSPCIVNEKIFLTGFNDVDSLLYTIAIDRENGKILWKDSVQPRGYYGKHPMYTYADPSMVSDGNKVFASFPNYGLIAYDLNGNKLREKIGSSPVAVDDVLYIRTDKHLYAFREP